MKKTLATEAQGVSDYLTAFTYMLADIVKAKDVPKKDKKWLRDIIVSIFKTQSVLDIAVAYDTVMKKYKPAERKRMERILAEHVKGSK